MLSPFSLPDPYLQLSSTAAKHLAPGFSIQHPHVSEANPWLIHAHFPRVCYDNLPIVHSEQGPALREKSRKWRLGKLVALAAGREGKGQRKWVKAVGQHQGARLKVVILLSWETRELKGVGEGVEAGRIRERGEEVRSRPSKLASVRRSKEEDEGRRLMQRREFAVDEGDGRRN